MEVFLIDLPRVTRLLAGAAPDAAEVLDTLRRRSPDAWDFDPEFSETSEGDVLESLLSSGRMTGRPHLAGRALQLLCRAVGEPLDAASFDDAGLGLVADALSGLPPAAQNLWQRLPTPLKPWGGNFPVVAYVTPAEAAEALGAWPEPDFDDPNRTVYAAREQIESWLRLARDRSQSVVVFWE